MSEEQASQSLETPQETVVEEKQTAVKDAFEAFGIEIEVETEDESEKDEEEAPAIEPKAESKTIKVKHNKEEIEADVSDDKLPELVQRSLALDKERERKAELEKNLDRAAKLAGYKDHTDYVANFDKIEQEQQLRQQQVIDDRIARLRQDAEDAGLDPDQVQEYLDNLPIVKEAAQIKQERDTERMQRQQEESRQVMQQEWGSMYNDPRVLAVFPDIVEDSKAFDSGEMPKFMTPEMKSRLERGYSPLDALILAHSDKFQGVTKKAAEQRIIKDQMLGKRSQVETNTAPNNEPVVSPALATAFSMFGLNPTAAKKYAKK